MSIYNPMPKLAFLACDYPQAQIALNQCLMQFQNYSIEECDIIVVMGGDGFMLHSLHQAYLYNKPVFGMNFGKVGFLMNLFNIDNLIRRLKAAHYIKVNPLQILIKDVNDNTTNHIAFNEVSLLRQTHQAAKLKISINNTCHLQELVGDGLIVATSIGSTAYNLSASGPIIPLNANLLALTPISPFRPRRWRGALLPDHMTIIIENNYPYERPINASADYHEVHNIKSITVNSLTTKWVELMFDPSHKLDDRIIHEQFMM